jgi:hypothetical protein
LAAGIYSYAEAYEGESAGTSSVTVRQSASGASIVEKATGTVNGMQIVGDATLTLGPDLTLAVYNGNYQSGAIDTVVTVTVSNGFASVISSSTEGRPQSFPLTKGARHFVVFEPGLVAGLFALPAQMASWSDAPFLAIAPSVARAENFTYDATIKPQRPADVPAADDQLSFGGQFAFTIWYDPTTLVPDEIVAPSQNLVITRVRAPSS